MIVFIAAMNKNRVIGFQGKLPWHLPADLNYFKDKTIGHCVIMGRKTFESIGCKPLPYRMNIVITSQGHFEAASLKIARSLEEAIQAAHSVKADPDEEIFIIGGAQIYRQALVLAEKIYLTEVDFETQGDAFFPQLSESDWILESEEPHQTDEKNKYAYSFKTYIRKRYLA